MYYYNNELPPQQGWVCPKCGRVNAPWLPTCGCVSSQTSGTPYLVKTSSISQDSHEITKDEPQAEPKYAKIIEAYSRGFEDGAEAVKAMPQTERIRKCIDCRLVSECRYTNPDSVICERFWQKERSE